MRDTTLYLKDILEAIHAIEEFVKDIDYDAFKEDDKTSSAVVRKFEIIGEASKNVPSEIKQKHSNIPWKKMAGFRDRLIHFYFGIQYKLVWDTIILELPNLKEQVKTVLDEWKGENDGTSPSTGH